MNTPAPIESDILATPAEARAGVERAFDVIRNHTVHTKGYVITALKVIEEFGDLGDKASLAEIMQEKANQLPVTGSKPPARPKRVAKKKSM